MRENAEDIIWREFCEEHRRERDVNRAHILGAYGLLKSAFIAGYSDGDVYGCMTLADANDAAEKYMDSLLNSLK